MPLSKSTSLQIINGITFVEGTEFGSSLDNSLPHAFLLPQAQRNLSFQNSVMNCSYHFRYITKLTLINDHIQNAGMEYIAQARWKFISSFQVHSNLTRQGIVHLNRCNWKFMTSLNLSNNRFYNSGLYELVKCNWPKLTFLNLDNTGITDDGIKILAKSKWPSLQHLDIAYNQLGNQAFKYLLRGNWPDLCQICFKPPVGYNEFLHNSMYIWQNNYSKLWRAQTHVLSGCDSLGLSSKYVRKIVYRQRCCWSESSFLFNEEQTQSQQQSQTQSFR